MQEVGLDLSQAEAQKPTEELALDTQLPMTRAE
jgi:hypothetical protein